MPNSPSKKSLPGVKYKRQSIGIEQMVRNDIDQLVRNLSKNDVPKVNLWKRKSISQLKNYDRSVNQMLAYQIYTKR